MSSESQAVAGTSFAELVSTTTLPASTATPVPGSTPRSAPPPADGPATPDDVTVAIAPVSAADDEGFVKTLTDIVNLVYKETEGDIFVDGYQRVSADELRGIIRAGELGVAYAVEGQQRVPIGCMRIHTLQPEATTAELGMLALDPARRSSGVGRVMVTFAEDHCRCERKLSTMRLELLVPVGFEHPFKMRLKAWYERLGYSLVRLGVFQDEYPHLAALLRGTTEYRVFEKSL
ncbi:hypothetical protein BX600DRAFT_444630 [Xylariales sp. PMI_506]|nr:hypothetical protein BX600DRAFT_444630 [Xylariales sp. PMI_506]